MQKERSSRGPLLQIRTLHWGTGLWTAFCSHRFAAKTPSDIAQRQLELTAMFPLTLRLILTKILTALTAMTAMTAMVLETSGGGSYSGTLIWCGVQRLAATFYAPLHARPRMCRFSKSFAAKSRSTCAE